MAEWLWRVTQAYAYDGQTIETSHGVIPRGFESHSFHQIFWFFDGRSGSGTLILLLYYMKILLYSTPFLVHGISDMWITRAVDPGYPIYDMSRSVLAGSISLRA